ncbi:MAG: hypothetical protein JSV39_04950, partial [Candidatus Aenigmatarchaeota archaeon]
MKIESYKPYHIGIKLKPYVDLDALKNDIIETLKTKGGYKITSKRKIDLGDVKIGFHLVGETIATKDDTKIQLDFSANALNSIGKDQKEVINVFKQLIEIMPKKGYDLKATISFYEIISIVFISEIELEKMFKNVLKINQKRIDSLGLNIQTDGFRLKSPKEIPSADFIFEPNPTNPKKSLSLKLSYRCNNIK